MFVFKVHKQSYNKILEHLMNEVEKRSFGSRYLKQKEEICYKESYSLGISDFEGKIG